MNSIVILIIACATSINADGIHNVYPGPIVEKTFPYAPAVEITPNIEITPVAPAVYPYPPTVDLVPPPLVQQPIYPYAPATVEKVYPYAPAVEIIQPAPIKPVEFGYGYSIPLTAPVYHAPVVVAPTPVYGLPPVERPAIPAPVYGLPSVERPVIPAPVYGLPAIPEKQVAVFDVIKPVAPHAVYGLPNF